MLARGFKQYADVPIVANGMDAVVGFKVKKVRGAVHLTGYWRLPDGEWKKLNEKPIHGKGAKSKVVQLAQIALEKATQSAETEKRFRETQVFVICGPSCGGKSTLKDTLIRRHRNKFQAVVTTTTRKERGGEQDGVDYHFVSKAEFEQAIEDDDLIEHDRVSGEYYGLTRGELTAAASSGKSPVIVATPAGIDPIRDWCKANAKKLTTVFVSAPATTLIERMILRFRSDSEASAQRYAARLDRLIQSELRWKEVEQFDIVDETSSMTSRERTVSRILGVCEIGLMREQLMLDNRNANESGRIHA